MNTPGAEGLVWVDSESDKPIGVALGALIQGATELSFRLAELFVDPSWQRHGIGGHLLEQLQRRVIALGARSIVLTTEGRPVEFYARHGYSEEPTWVAMTRRLD